MFLHLRVQSLGSFFPSAPDAAWIEGVKASKKVEREKANDLNKTNVVFFAVVDIPGRNALRSLADESPFHLCL